MKKCFKCGQIKPLDDFYKHPQMPDGRVNKCKECNKKENKENRKAKLEHYRKYDRKRASQPHRVEARRSYYQKAKKKDNWKEKSYIKTKKYRENNPLKYKARNAVNNAIRDGKLVRKPCEVCGCSNSEAHHDDYSNPFDIKWLCRKHHMELHKKRGDLIRDVSMDN